MCDGFCRCDERIGRRQDGIARLYAARDQCKEKGICAAGNTDAFRHSNKGGEMLFKAIEHRAPDERGIAESCTHNLHQLGFEFQMGCYQIKKWD